MEAPSSMEPRVSSSGSFKRQIDAEKKMTTNVNVCIDLTGEDRSDDDSSVEFIGNSNPSPKKRSKKMSQ